VIRQLEILGEAASRVDQAYRSSTPQIPWSKVISTRNRLIHGYFSVDLEIVYRTATHHVPGLRPTLENAVGDPEQKGEIEPRRLTNLIWTPPEINQEW